MLPFAAIWMDMEGIMLSEISPLRLKILEGGKEVAATEVRVMVPFEAEEGAVPGQGHTGGF